jgi:hypothetical protein
MTNESIKYLETEDKLTIVILPIMKPITKTGIAFMGILAIGLSITFTIVILYSLFDMGFMALVFGSFAAFGFYVGMKYLERAFNKEIIEITKDSITIIDKYLLKKEVKTFMVTEILNLDFVGRNNFTPHPLTGNSVDYTGFGVSEKELQYVIEDGAIEISSKQETKRFGKNIPSWDTEVIMTRVKKFTIGQIGKKGDAV